MSRKGQVYRHQASHLKPLSEAAKGYIAGLLDGEGHLYIRGEYEGACYSRVRIRITDEPIVIWLLETTGVGNVSSHLPSQRRRDGGAKKRIYEWQVGKRDDVKGLLQAILPYLIIKANRARWVLEFESLKDQGVGNGMEVRRLIDLIASEQSHKPIRAGREGLAYSFSKDGKIIHITGGIEPILDEKA